MMRAVLVAGAIAIGWSGAGAVAAPTLDGTGFGLPSATVLYDPAAPTSNFGTPGPTTSGAAYNVFTRADTTYAYVLLRQTGAGSSSGMFANLYFGTGATAMSGPDVGFEVTNSDVFSLSSAAAPVSTNGTGIAYASLFGGTAIEFAVPFTYFETDPQSIGFSTTSAANPNIVLRLSQAFGYSVAGGAIYGSNRLGLIVDPIGTTTVPQTRLLRLARHGRCRDRSSTATSGQVAMEVS